MPVNPQLENGFVRVATEIWEAWASTRIPGEAEQILKTIVRKTYGWNKKSDIITLSQFYTTTKIPKHRRIRGLQKLTQMNIITQKGNGKEKRYSINKDYPSWKSLPKKVTTKSLPKKVTIITQKGNYLLPKKVTPINTIDTNTINKINKAFTHLDTPAFKEIWEAWLEVRKKIKAPNTTRALELSLKKLHRYPIKTSILMLEQSVERGWRGVFPIKDIKNSPAYVREPEAKIPVREEVSLESLQTISDLVKGVVKKCKDV